MHIGWHITSAIPFLGVGQLDVAAGCVLPDVVWVFNEIKIQKAKESPYSTIEKLKDKELLPYRIFHSILFWMIVSMCGLQGVALGAAIHICLDLPTHKGRMYQQPLYPLRWRWPWVL